MSSREILDALYPKRSKFNVDQSAKGKEKRTCDGIVFDSIDEMNDYRTFIKPNVKAGIFKNLRLQHVFPLWAFDPKTNEPQAISSYVADFVIDDLDGKTHVFESKGHRTAMYRLKAKWFAVCYPDLRIEEL